MCNYYRRKKYEVLIAHDDQDAIPLINQRSPDIIIVSNDVPNWKLIRQHAAAVAPHAKFLVMEMEKEKIRQL